MDDDDLPRTKGEYASRLAAESLDRLSQDELESRIRLLELEITRTRTHMKRAADHRNAAELLFRPPA
jgi:uncharacterized small protein (DUF1192 family)